MSSQRGNIKRTRPQKHKNKYAFSYVLHTPHVTKQTILNTNNSFEDVCKRCADILEWKATYRKYIPLTRPKTCIKCQQKNVKLAYRIVCSTCADKNSICPKCVQSLTVDTIPSDVPNNEVVNELKSNLYREVNTDQHNLYEHFLITEKAASGTDLVGSNEEQEEDNLTERTKIVRFLTTDNKIGKSIRKQSNENAECCQCQNNEIIRELANIDIS